jgi:hypothetical protein
MNILARGWLLPGLTLLASLILLGYWLMQPDHAVNAPSSIAATTPADLAPAATKPPVIAETADENTLVAGKEPAGGKSAFSTFRGRVIDAATRKPIREFEVEFHGTQKTKVGKEAPGARTFKSDDGRFEWDYLPPGAWTVTASAAGYQRFDLMSLQLTKGEATQEIVLPMRRGQTLRGRIYDEETGVGIGGASIGFREAASGRFEGNWRMRTHLKSAKDGTFVLDGVPSGRVILSVNAHEHASRDLDVTVGADNAPLEIALSVGGRIAGRLTAADGVTPVAGEIGLFRLDEGSGVSHPLGKTGEFSWEHLPAGRYQLSGQSGAGGVTREIVLARNQRLEGIVLALGAGGSTIRGTIRGLKPEDLRHLAISIHRNDLRSFLSSQVRADDRGAYTVQGVQPGSWTVMAEVGMRRQMNKIVEVPADSDVTVNFDFPPGARLSGRVTRGGKPFTRVWVSPRPAIEQAVYTHGTNTSNDGTYAIEDLADGEYVLEIGSYRSKPIEVSGDTVFDVDVPLVQISGSILEEGGKVPIVDAVVEIWPTEPTSERTRQHDRSNHFGQFDLVGLEPGEYLLTVYKAGYEMIRKPIAYESPVTDMTLRLRRDAGVAISVRSDVTTRRLQHIYVVEKVGEGNGIRLVVPLSEDGEGYLPSALANSTLSFAAGDFKPIVVDPWNGERLDLRLERARPKR